MLKSSGITNFKGLEGKKISITPGNSHKFYFPKVAEKSGTDPNKIVWVNMDGGAMAAQLLAKNIEFGKWIWRSYWQEGPFDFGDPSYLREGVDLFSALGRARIPSPWLPMNAFIARWYFGMTAMLYRLRARVDMRAIYLRERVAAGWGPA